MQSFWQSIVFELIHGHLGSDADFGSSLGMPRFPYRTPLGSIVGQASKFGIVGGGGTVRGLLVVVA